MRLPVKLSVSLSCYLSCQNHATCKPHLAWFHAGYASHHAKQLKACFEVLNACFEVQRGALTFPMIPKSWFFDIFRFVSTYGGGASRPPRRFPSFRFRFRFRFNFRLIWITISILRPIRPQFYIQFDLNFTSNSTSILGPIRDYSTLFHNLVRTDTTTITSR